MANSLLRDDSGATLFEFTVVMPLLILVTFGLVDLGLLMFTRSDANRAVQLGARCAVTNNPVAKTINDGMEGTDTTIPVGTACTSTSVCKLKAEYTCSATDTGTGGNCTSGKGTLAFDSDAFKRIVEAMVPFSRNLDRRQVEVVYTPLMQGFVGQKSTPMNVTVRLRCVGQPLYFVAGLVGWAFTDSKDCAGIPNSSGIPISASATLPSEDLTREAGDTTSCVPRS